MTSVRQERHGLTQRVIGGWQLNGIATMLSGFPLTPQSGSNRSGDGDTRNPDRPSLNPGVFGTGDYRKSESVVQPGCVSRADGWYLGKSGRGTYDGPGLAEVDFSLFKNIPLTEGRTCSSARSASISRTAPISPRPT